MEQRWAASDAIDGVIRSRLHELGVSEYGTTGRQIEAALMESSLGDRVAALYRTYCEGGTEPPDALARAMAEGRCRPRARRRRRSAGAKEPGGAAGSSAPWSDRAAVASCDTRYSAIARASASGRFGASSQ